MIISNKIISTAFIIAIIVTVCGCGKKTIEDSSPVEEKTTPEIVVEVEDNSLAEEKVEIPDESNEPTFESPYHFFDVFRKEYEMEINPSIEPNRLNPEGFSYISTDATGKVLSDVEITNETDLYIDGTEMTGYTGVIKYEDERYTSKFGIDVSKFQGNINYEKAKEAGVEFVIVRVGFRGYGSSGSLSEDAKYRQNIEGAMAAGLDVGVYFYAQAINEEEAIEEADYVLKLIEGYNLNLPVVYDPEHVLNDTARTDDVSGEQFTRNARAFADRIRSAGYEPMVYANMLWEAYELDLSKLSDVKIWYADYELKPQSPYEFEMWQYSQAGKISGIDGSVDLNMMLISK